MCKYDNVVGMFESSSLTYTKLLQLVRYVWDTHYYYLTSLNVAIKKSALIFDVECTRAI